MSDTNASGAVPLSAPKRIEGIGGWLILPIFNVVVAVIALGLFALEHAPDVLAPPPGTWAGSIFQNGEFFVGSFLVLTAALCAYSILCLVSLAQKRKRTSTLMMAFFWLIVVWAVLNAAGLFYFGSDQELDAGMTDAVKGLAQALTPAVIWTVYFRVSQRVKNTFVR